MSDLLQPTLDPSLLPTEVIEAELIASVSAQTATIHTQLRLLETYDQRGAWAAGGATSCADWWASVADIELSTARDQLRVARALVEFPSLDAVLETQELSYAKVRYLARYVEPETVDELVKLAQRVPAGKLGYALAAYRAAGMTNDEMTAMQLAGRSVSFKTDADGMFVVTCRLLPADGADLTAQIDSEMMRGNTRAGDLVGQQRADGLMLVLARRLSNSVTSQAAAEVVVHVVANEEGALIHTLADGTPLPQAQAAELMCGATLRAIVHDSKGKPIDVSPSAPRPTKRQLHLINARDKHCQYEACRATTFLHAHHIRHREHGGPTTIANLTLVCSFHHRHIHTEDPGWVPAWKQALP